MKNRTFRVAFIATAATLLPMISHAQGFADDIHSLQGVLDTLFNDMIPKCARLMDVGRGIAGFAAMWFIAVRVWRHIAAAEPIDFFPLLRPFVIGFCILVFPSVLALINGVLQPTVTATHAMIGDSNQAIELMTTPKQPGTEQGMPSTSSEPDKWYQYTNPNVPAGATMGTAPMAEQFSGWGFKNMIRRGIAEFLNICYEAAALAIDTIRVFKLIVLAILGPLAFGLSVFDGFQHTLKQWLARYINVYMWLPVANVFGAIMAKIQENIIRADMNGGAANPHFGDANTAYLIFMLIGIVGYFTVPSIASYIINAGGGHALLNKTTSLVSSAVSFGSGMFMQNMMNRKGNDNEPQNNPPSNNSGDSSANGNFMKNQLTGKT